MNLPKPSLTSVTEDQEKRLSEILEEINEQFDLNIEPEVGMSGAVSIRELLKKNPRLKQSAHVNSREDFKFAFEEEIDNALTEGILKVKICMEHFSTMKPLKTDCQYFHR